MESFLSLSLLYSHQPSILVYFQDKRLRSEHCCWEKLSFSLEVIFYRLQPAWASIHFIVLYNLSQICFPLGNFKWQRMNGQSWMRCSEAASASIAIQVLDWRLCLAFLEPDSYQGVSTAATRFKKRAFPPYPLNSSFHLGNHQWELPQVCSKSLFCSASFDQWPSLRLIAKLIRPHYE